MNEYDKVSWRVRFAEDVLQNEREVLMRNPCRENEARAIAAEQRLERVRAELASLKDRELVCA